MTYDSVLPDMFERIPEIRGRSPDFVGTPDEEPLTYLALGSLIELLAQALVEGDLRLILLICAFLEDMAESAASDNRLTPLLQIEVGEWLGVTDHEERLAPWLGTETKRICRYVPGLATQRRAIKSEQGSRSTGQRLLSAWKRFFRR